jgi:catechol 2,3-dioxygenase-like lactoylglutathione lyase family enzyme
MSDATIAAATEKSNQGVPDVTLSGGANFLLLYVDNPKVSGSFYADLLGLTPVETSPTFALFALPSGLMLGLWSRYTVEPAVTVAAAGGGGELAFTVKDAAAVDALYALWGEKGLRILQKPVELDFGYTFVAMDPDGHRLRVFAPVG